MSYLLSLYMCYKMSIRLQAILIKYIMVPTLNRKKMIDIKLPAVKTNALKP